MTVQWARFFASIRRIVTDEERARRGGKPGDVVENGVFVLTSDMRVDGPDGKALVLGGRDAPRVPAIPSEAELEEMIRRVIREELRGSVGVEISRRVKSVIQDEVRRALAENEPLI